MGQKDNTQPARGYTLPEMMVVVVVLAVIGALVVPSFIRFISSGEGKKTAIELGVLARDANTYRAGSADISWREALEETVAELDVTGVDVELAEQTVGPLPSSRYGHIIYKSAGDTLGLATLSQQGAACYARAAGGKVDTWCASSVSVADGHQALLGPSGTESASYSNLPAPGQPTILPGDQSLSLTFVGTGAVFEAECAAPSQPAVRATAGIIPQSPTVTVSVGGLANGVPYSCRVRAGDNTTWSDWSAEATGTPQAWAGLGRPTLTASAATPVSSGTAHVTLTLTAVPGASDYETTCTPATGSASYTMTGPGPHTLTVLPNTNYDCRARAGDGSRLGQWSDTASVIWTTTGNAVGPPDIYFTFDELASGPRSQVHDVWNAVPGNFTNGPLPSQNTPVNVNGGPSFVAYGGASATSTNVAFKFDANANMAAAGWMTMAGWLKPQGTANAAQDIAFIGGYRISYNNRFRTLSVDYNGVERYSTYAYLYTPGVAFHYTIGIQNRTVTLFVDGTVALEKTFAAAPLFTTGQVAVLGQHDELKVWRDINYQVTKASQVPSQEYVNGKVAADATPAERAAVSMGAYGHGFVPLSPVRVGSKTTYGPPDGTSKLTVSGGVAGVPTFGVSALAVTIKATDLANQPGGNVVVAWPAGATIPASSNLNVPPLGTAANTAIVKVGSNQQIHVGTHYAANVEVFVTGFYLERPGVRAEFYTPLATPLRMLETRNSGGYTATNTCFGSCAGQIGGGATTKLVKIADGIVIPSEADSVVVNVTAANFSGSGSAFIALGAADADGWWNGSSSNLNFGPNEQIANVSVVRLARYGGYKGALWVYVPNHTSTDVVIDVIGYYRNPDNPSNVTGLKYVPASTAQRIVDTRYNSGVCANSEVCTTLSASNVTDTMQMWGRGTIPNPASGEAGGERRAYVTGVAANVTSVDQNAANGTLVLYPAGTSTIPDAVSTAWYQSYKPIASFTQPMVSETAGQTKISFPTAPGGMTTNYFVDIQGWFQGERPAALCAYFDSSTGMCTA